MIKGNQFVKLAGEKIKIAVSKSVSFKAGTELKTKIY